MDDKLFRLFLTFIHIETSTYLVINDGDMNLWQELGVNSWPTFAVVGPNGKLLEQLSGEGCWKDLDDLVEAALLFYGEKKLLDNDPCLLTSPLKFPQQLTLHFR
ncbi:hypothetical protein Q3G72_003841 [Acer saccharum]|nr:hypothetical protein Q3G72_003841 [Acer saccharum]